MEDILKLLIIAVVIIIGAAFLIAVQVGASYVSLHYGWGLTPANWWVIWGVAGFNILFAFCATLLQSLIKALN